jgi:hypothetical protein
MTIPGPEHWWIGTVDERSGETVTLWDGGGRIANEKGDIYGTSPARIIRFGKVSIDATRALEVVANGGWRFCAVQPTHPDDEGVFARIERTEKEREAWNR